MHAVTITGLSKRFTSRKTVIHALRDVSLQIEEREIFGLLGPNGAGKTTLISILAGTTSPDAGRVTVLGKDLVRDLQAIQQSLNMVRGFGGVLHKCTLAQLMRYYAYLYEVPHAKARIESLLKTLGLWDRRDQYVSEFSSGWRQRFFIAKALLNDPKLLLMDEPTVGLDVDAAQHVRAFIASLRAEGRTILLTTHYMREAEELCGRIALISDGRIVAQGTPASLKAMVRTEEAIEIRGVIPDAALDVLRGLAGVDGAHRHGEVARLLVKDRAVMHPVLECLAEAKAKVESVRLEEPTLEDVFLKLTKRGLENDEA